MRLIIEPNYEQVSEWAARYVASRINAANPTPEKPFVLGCPTGSSPLGMYKKLIELNKAGKVSFQNVITFNMDETTICHEVETKVTGAHVLMKPAAPGTGIIAGGTVRSIIGLTGVKNLISKSLGSTNKVNIAYAVIENLKAQVPRSEWNTTAKKAEAPKKAEKKSAKKEDK